MNGRGARGRGETSPRERRAAGGKAGGKARPRARDRAARERRPAREPEGPTGLATLGPLNYALLGAALVSIVVGYVLLDRGSITAAPLLLVLGYVVLIPAGLLIGSRTPETER